MGFFSSKTKYYVSSSNFPIFDPKKRVNQYESAMLDYTANSSLEQSEYMRNYYDISKLQNYRGFLRWWGKNKYADTFGTMNGVFYGDARINNNEVRDAIKDVVPIPEEASLTVYSSNLAFFSEDFWIKYLATQQGKANWVYQDSDIDYELEYPDDHTIVAKWSDGRTIQGSLPQYTTNTRFLEISYSYVFETEEVIPPETEEDQETTVSTINYRYGYYHYQEGTGNVSLDTIIRNNGIQGAYTFFPVVPIRTNTSWYGGDHADKISAALDYLEVFGRKEEDPAYVRLQEMLVEGMTSGSMGDVDYITLILGVAIGSTWPADTKYLYEFFFNLHTNFALSQGATDERFIPKDLSAGQNYMGNFFTDVFTRFYNSSSASQFYRSFVINCPSSNLNLTYQWGGSDYFEANGQFKPDAKPGDYGVLSGSFTHRWSTQEPKRDSEGNVIVSCNEDECHVVMETVWHEIDYNLTFFCNQRSQNRWRFVVFVDLGERNLVYHGKSIYIDAHAAHVDAAEVKSITHNFQYDFPSAPGEYHQFTLQYITAQGDFNNTMIVPLEWSTFMECGAVTQLDIAYGSLYLIFNCWVKKKIKWYQDGFMGMFVSFLGMVLAPIVPILDGLIFAISATLFTIFTTAKLLELALKTFQLVFGEALGTALYNIFKTIIVAVICRIVACIPVFGTLIAAGIVFTITAAEILNAGGSLSDALKGGLIAGAMAGVGASVGSAVSASAGTVAGAMAQGFITSFGSSFAKGGDIGDALKAGAVGGLAAGAMEIAGDFLKDIGLIEVKSEGAGLKSPGEFSLEKAFENLDLGDLFKVEVLENPFTYTKLLGAAIDEINMKKMQNLENDYQEFNNRMATANNLLMILNAQQDSVTTAEFVCKIQSNMGRMLMQFPDMMVGMTPDDFLSITTASGSSFCDSVIQSVPTFTESKLTLQGFTPDELHYNKEFVSFTA